MPVVQERIILDSSDMTKWISDLKIGKLISGLVFLDPLMEPAMTGGTG